MPTVEFITALFSQVDDQMPGVPKHPHATLWPSEIVMLGLRPCTQWLRINISDLSRAPCVV